MSVLQWVFWVKFHVACSTNCTATEKMCVSFVFIVVKRITMKENWTSLVQSVLYLHCTSLAWFSLVILVLFATKKITDHTWLKFCSFNRFFWPACGQRLLTHTTVLARPICYFVNHLELDCASTSFHRIGPLLAEKGFKMISCILIALIFTFVLCLL